MAIKKYLFLIFLFFQITRTMEIKNENQILEIKGKKTLSTIPMGSQSRKIQKSRKKLQDLYLKKFEANLILRPLKTLVDKKKQYQLDLCLKTIRQDISTIKSLFGYDEDLFFLSLMDNDIASGSIDVQKFRQKEQEQKSKSQWKKIYFHCLLDQKFKISCKSRLYNGGKFKDLNNFLNHPMVQFFNHLLKDILDESQAGILDHKCLINLLQYGNKSISKYLKLYVNQFLPSWPNREQWNQFKNNNKLDSNWAEKVIISEENNLFFPGKPNDPRKNIEIKRLIFSYILHQMQLTSNKKSQEVTIAMILPYPSENRPVDPIIHFEIIKDYMYPYSKSLEKLAQETNSTFLELNPQSRFLLTAKYVINGHRALDVFEDDKKKTEEMEKSIKNFIRFHNVLLQKSFKNLPLLGYQQILCTIASYLLPSHWSLKTIYDLFFNKKSFEEEDLGAKLTIDDH